MRMPLAIARRLFYLLAGQRSHTQPTTLSEHFLLTHPVLIHVGTVLKHNRDGQTELP